MTQKICYCEKMTRTSTNATEKILSKSVLLILKMKLMAKFYFGHTKDDQFHQIHCQMAPRSFRFEINFAPLQTNMTKQSLKCHF